MKCNNCGSKMNYDHTIERGRHVREVYRCPSCNLRCEKKVKTLSDMSRMRF